MDAPEFEERQCENCEIPFADCDCVFVAQTEIEQTLFQKRTLRSFAFAESLEDGRLKRLEALVDEKRREKRAAKILARAGSVRILCCGRVTRMSQAAFERHAHAFLKNKSFPLQRYKDIYRLIDEHGKWIIMFGHWRVCEEDGASKWKITCTAGRVSPDNEYFIHQMTAKMGYVMEPFTLPRVLEWQTKELEHITDQYQVEALQEKFADGNFIITCLE